MRPSRPIRVTHLIAPVRFGGGEALLTDLLASPRDDLIESVVTVGLAPVLESGLAASGVRVLALGRREAGMERAGRATELARAVPLIAELRRHVRELAPDVIHSHGFPPSLLAALPLGSPVGRVYMHHYERQPPGRTEQAFLGAVFNRYDRLTTPADHLTDAMNRHFPHLRRPFTTLRAGLADRFYQGTPSSTWRRALPSCTSIGVSVGRLVDTKNQRLIIESLAALDPEDRDGLGVLLVGSGPQEQELKDLVASTGLHDRVAFLGQVERAAMPDLLASADFGLFPTTTEASSLAAGEALAAGLPIVCLDIPSMVETVGAAGMVGPPASFGANMASMARTHGRFADAVRSRAKRYEMATVRSTWAGLYHEVIEG